MALAPSSRPSHTPAAIAIIPPIALDGPQLSIRRFPSEALGLDRLVETGTLPALALNPHEQQLLELLGDGEHQMDELIRASGLPPSTVSVTLLSLEMKHLVRQLPGRLFTRSR